MPIWLSILVSIALKFGVPWLLKAFPWLSPALVAQVQAEVESLLAEKKAYHSKRKYKIRCASRKCHEVHKQCT